MKKNVLLEKSYLFALRIVRLCRYLSDTKHEYVISKQVLFNGTAVGAQVEEAQQAFNRSDFWQQMALANKFAFKTHYWLRILRDSGYINESEFESIVGDCDELRKLLMTVIKTTKESA
jgi:four helix bundle protein